MKVESWKMILIFSYRLLEYVFNKLNTKENHKYQSTSKKKGNIKGRILKNCRSQVIRINFCAPLFHFNAKQIDLFSSNIYGSRVKHFLFKIYCTIWPFWPHPWVWTPQSGAMNSIVGRGFHGHHYQAFSFISKCVHLRARKVLTFQFCIDKLRHWLLTFSICVDKLRHLLTALILPLQLNKYCRFNWRYS